MRGDWDDEIDDWIAMACKTRPRKGQEKPKKNGKKKQ